MNENSAIPFRAWPGLALALVRGPQGSGLALRQITPEGSQDWYRRIQLDGLRDR